MKTKTKKLISLVAAIAVILTLIPALPGAIFTASPDLTRARTEFDAEVERLRGLETLTDINVADVDAVFAWLEAAEGAGWAISDHYVDYEGSLALVVDFEQGDDFIQIIFEWYDVKDGVFVLNIVKAGGSSSAPPSELNWYALKDKVENVNAGQVYLNFGGGEEARLIQAVLDTHDDYLADPSDSGKETAFLEALRDLLMYVENSDGPAPKAYWVYDENAQAYSDMLWYLRDNDDTDLSWLLENINNNAYDIIWDILEMIYFVNLDNGFELTLEEIQDDFDEFISGLMTEGKVKNISTDELDAVFDLLEDAYDEGYEAWDYGVYLEEGFNYDYINFSVNFDGFSVIFSWEDRASNGTFVLEYMGAYGSFDPGLDFSALKTIINGNGGDYDYYFGGDDDLISDFVDYMYGLIDDNSFTSIDSINEVSGLLRAVENDGWVLNYYDKDFDYDDYPNEPYLWAKFKFYNNNDDELELYFEWQDTTASPKDMRLIKVFADTCDRYGEPFDPNLDFDDIKDILNANDGDFYPNWFDGPDGPFDPEDILDDFDDFVKDLGITLLTNEKTAVYGLLAEAVYKGWEIYNPVFDFYSGKVTLWLKFYNSFNDDLILSFEWYDDGGGAYLGYVNAQTYDYWDGYPFDPELDFDEIKAILKTNGGEFNSNFDNDPSDPTDPNDDIKLSDLWGDFEKFLDDLGIELIENEMNAVYNLLTDAIEEDGWKIDWHYSYHVVGYYTYICLEVAFIKGSDEFEVYFSWHEIEDSGDFRLMYVEAYGDKTGQDVVWDRLGKIINDNWLLNENLSYYGEIDLFGLCNICKEDCGGDCYDILDYLGTLFNETFEGANDDLFIISLVQFLSYIDPNIEVYEDLAEEYRAAFIAMEYEYCIGKCELDDCISCAGGYLHGIYYQPYWFYTDRTVLNYVINSIVAAVDDVNEKETVPVTFNYMDGRPNTSLKVVKSGAITRPADPEREGYVFDGWYTNTSFTQSWNFTSTLEGLTSVGLYAKWTCVDHVYGEYVHNNDATCEDHGTETATCTGDNCTVTDERAASSGALGHSFTDYKDDTATCTAGGVKTATCDNNCGTTAELSTSALGHDMKETAPEEPATCTVAGKKAVLTCSRTGCDETEGGETITALGHDTEETAEEIPATCTLAGKEAVLTCSRNCGYTEGGDAITALGHDFKNYVSDDNATCLADGTETANCDNGCGEKDIKTVTGTKLEHLFTDYKNDTATCTVGGVKTATCDRGCGEEDELPTSALGHSFTNYTGNTATCTAGGVETATCDRTSCNEQDELPTSALGHDLPETWTVRTAPTCENDGVEYKACQRGGCTYEETQPINKLGHSFTNYTNDTATCESGGVETATCDRTGCNEQDELPTSALGHSFTNYTGNTATCTAGGVETATCDRTSCNEQDELPTSALGHSFANYTGDTATCLDAGEETGTCSRENCTEENTRPTSPLDHDFQNYESDNNATCTEHGTETGTCIRCGETNSIMEIDSMLPHTPKTENCTECSVCTTTGLSRTCSTESPCTFHTPDPDEPGPEPDDPDPDNGGGGGSNSNPINSGRRPTSTTNTTTTTTTSEENESVTGTEEIIIDVPVTVIQEIAGNLPTTQIAATSAGSQLITTAAANAGQNAVLLVFNEETGEFEVVSAATVNADGTATVNVPGAGDYIVVVAQTGDLTGTGNVTAADALLLLQALTGNAELNPLQKFLTSSRSDSNFTATDALNILKFVAGMIDEL